MICNEGGHPALTSKGNLSQILTRGALNVCNTSQPVWLVFFFFQSSFLKTMLWETDLKVSESMKLVSTHSTRDWVAVIYRIREVPVNFWEWWMGWEECAWNLTALKNKTFRWWPELVLLLHWGLGLASCFLLVLWMSTATVWILPEIAS